MIYTNYSAIFYYFIPQLLSDLFRNFLFYGKICENRENSKTVLAETSITKKHRQYLLF